MTIEQPNAIDFERLQTIPRFEEFAADRDAAREPVPAHHPATAKQALEKLIEDLKQSRI